MRRPELGQVGAGSGIRGQPDEELPGGEPEDLGRVDDVKEKDREAPGQRVAAQDLLPWRGRLGPGPFRRFQPLFAATASISTAAPLGRAETSTVARAGNGSLKPRA